MRDVRVLGAIGVVQLDHAIDMAAATRAAVREGVWLRPFRDLVYTMPPYVTGDEDVARIAPRGVRGGGSGLSRADTSGARRLDGGAVRGPTRRERRGICAELPVRDGRKTDTKNGADERARTDAVSWSRAGTEVGKTVTTAASRRRHARPGGRSRC